MKPIMKSLMSITAVFAFSATLAAQSTETRTVGDFNGVRATGMVVLELSQTDVNSVTLVGDARALPLVITEVRNGTLVVSTDKANSRNNDKEVVVRVGVKQLRLLDVSGAVEVSCKDTLRVDTLDVVGSGATELKLLVKGNALQVGISGASELRAAGTVDYLEAGLSGASQFKGYQLRTKRVSVTTSGASDAKLSVSDALTAVSSGASSVRYYGNPTNPSINTSGSASVERKEGQAAVSDTTRLTIAGRQVQIVDNDDDDDDQRSEREKKADDEDFEFWNGFDIGTAGYLSANRQIELPRGFEPFELNYAKSYLFSWNIFQKNIHIYRNNLNLGTGIGLSWYHYNFKGNYSLDRNVAFQTATLDTARSYSKNRLNMCYVNVPLFLEFNTNNADASRSFHMGAGMQFGYNIFKNKLKQRYEENGQTEKRAFKDDYNVNPFRYDVIARIGYGDYSIFGSYSLSTLFEREKGPVFYPFTAGIHIDL